MKALLLAVSLFAVSPLFADQAQTPINDDNAQTQLSWDQPGFICSTQCANSSCGRVCSTQQRCQTYCTPNGDAACYCFL